LSFSPEQLQQLADRGISAEEGHRQLGLLREPPPPAALRRPCTVGDGIRRLDDAERGRLTQRWLTSLEDESKPLQIEKFVPASGAATRMFKSLHAARDAHADGVDLRSAAEAGDSNARFALNLFDRIGEMALSGPLEEKLGKPIHELIDGGSHRDVLDTMLNDSPGLALGAQPKGLLPFHLYPEGSRTALEEHMIEGIGYLGSERARFHFTVSPAHRRDFEQAARSASERLATRGIELETSFSVQDPATDTIAIDDNGHPLIDGNERLVFRPAGHGALLHNLAQLEADLVFVKNIDNVMPEPKQADTIAWKRTLGGLALEMNQRLAAELEALHQGERNVDRAWRFLSDQMAIEPPSGLHNEGEAEQREYLLDRLSRPLRVCGMVRNEGEPGGGPFWVEGALGEVTPQVVESAQVDLSSSDQANTWNAATHFNPVDLVCCMRRPNGERFDFAEYCDDGASFVSSKSIEGQPITVLERPGLWNGAMAGWNTLFVEVPITTFSPVKTILDLLKPEHLVG